MPIVKQKIPLDGDLQCLKNNCDSCYAILSRSLCSAVLTIPPFILFIAEIMASNTNQGVPTVREGGSAIQLPHTRRQPWSYPALPSVWRYDEVQV